MLESAGNDAGVYCKVDGGHGDARKSRKAVFRRTIDYNASVLNYLRERMFVRRWTDRIMIQPDYLWSPKLCTPKEYLETPMSCVMSKPVRTSTNKNKCPIYCVCWTPEGRRLITGAFSGEFTLWNGLTFNFETILQAHESQIRCMKWSHNDEWLLTADHSGYVKYWQANMNNVEMYQAHKEPIRGVSFCPFDNKFVTCSDDSTVRIWDFHGCVEERVLRGHGSDVRSVAWHPTLSLIISGSKDAQQPIKLWDPKTGESVNTLYIHKNTCTDVAWNDNGNWFLTASRDHLIKLFDLRNLKTELQTFRGHKRDVMRVVWHPFHECLFASGSADGAIFYWLAGTETELGAVENAHDSMIWSLAWHPFGHILVSGANDFATKFWTRNRPGDILKESTVADSFLHMNPAAAAAAAAVVAASTEPEAGGEQGHGHHHPNLSSELALRAISESLMNSSSTAVVAKVVASSTVVDQVDEIAFVQDHDEAATAMDIPGLNEGSLLCSMTASDDMDFDYPGGGGGGACGGVDRSKLRSMRTIPKEFAANWASTRITAMPSIMVPTAHPPSASALAVAAAAAVVAVNNLTSTPQYLPPVKPTPAQPVTSSASTTTGADDDDLGGEWRNRPDSGMHFLGQPPLEHDDDGGRFGHTEQEVGMNNWNGFADREPHLGAPGTDSNRNWDQRTREQFGPPIRHGPGVPPGARPPMPPHNFTPPSGHPGDDRDYRDYDRSRKPSGPNARPHSPNAMDGQMNGPSGRYMDPFGAVPSRNDFHGPRNPDHFGMEHSQQSLPPPGFFGSQPQMRGWSEYERFPPAGPFHPQPPPPGVRGMPPPRGPPFPLGRMPMGPPMPRPAGFDAGNFYSPNSKRPGPPPDHLGKFPRGNEVPMQPPPGHYSADGSASGGGGGGPW